MKSSFHYFRFILFVIVLFLATGFYSVDMIVDKAASTTGIYPMAAVEIPGRGLYLFRGDEYYKYEYINKERRLLAGYPKKLPGGWQGLPESFHAGIDAAFYYPPTKKTYFFKGNKYIRLSGIKVDEGFPKTMANGWSNLPAEYGKNLDAAMYYAGDNGKPGHIILVKNNKYVSYSKFKLGVVDGDIKEIWGAKKLPEPFDKNIEAMATRGITNDLSSPGTWLFHKNTYTTAPGLILEKHPGSLRMAGVDAPKATTTKPPSNNSGGIVFNKSQKPNMLIAVWGSIGDMKDWNVKKSNLKLPDRTKITADAAVYIPEMGTYVFSGNQYYKYKADLSSKNAPTLLSNYPQKLPGGWQGLPKEFHSNIDASFYHVGNKTTYLFKGGEYLRIKGRKADGKPRRLPGGWKGLPKSFYHDIDAAFVVGIKGKSYVILVKNAYFVAFHNWTNVATGKIKDLWNGLPRGFNKEIDAIAHGGFLGNYLFSGEQVLFANGHQAGLAPGFHMLDLPNSDNFREPETADAWKLKVRNRPAKKSLSGSNNGIDIAVMPKSSSKKSSGAKEIKRDKTEEGNYSCVVKHMDETMVSPDQILLDPTTRVIWPGAIIDGKSIVTGEYKLLNYPRNNYKISISARDIEKSGITVTQPQELDHVRDQVNALISRIPVNNYPNEKAAFSLDETQSSRQFQIKFGGSYNAGVASVSAGLNINTETKMNRLVISYVQQIFSIDVVHNNHYSKWIKEPSKIDFYNSMPMYVSTVKYGRRAYMSVESTESLESLETYFSAEYYGASVDVKTKAIETLKNSKVKVYIAGSSAKDAASGATGKYEDFLNYLTKAPKSASDVFPIGYTMNFLKDNSVAKVGLTSKYKVRNCTAHALKWKATLTQINQPSGVELYGRVGVEFYDKDDNKLSGVRLWDRDHDQTIESSLIGVDKEHRHRFKSIDQLKGAYVRLIAKFTESEWDGNERHPEVVRKIRLSNVQDGMLAFQLKSYFKDHEIIAHWKIETY